jgi:ATP adenylyltransferase
MQRLFTPWRFSYISESIPRDGCFFCDAARNPEDPDRLVVFVGEYHVVMLNKFPYSSGHLLVAPFAHISDPLDEEPKASAELWPLVLKSQRILKQAYAPQGFNMGINLGIAGGAGVPGHYHYHVVPRWEGDTNFMTVLGEVRLMPEEGRSVVERLRPLFQEETV